MALIMMDAAPICNEVSIVADIDEVLVQLAEFQEEAPYTTTEQKNHLIALKTYFYMECKQVIAAYPDVFDKLCKEADFIEQVTFHQLEPYVDFALHGKYGAYLAKDYPLNKGAAVLQQTYRVLWRGTFTCVVQLSS
jgi:hypothetical protein